MSEGSNNPRFCEGCPFIPENVVAEVESVVPVGPELGQYRFAYDDINEVDGMTGKELAGHLRRFSRLTARVIESANPKIAVGDEATVMVLADTKGEAAIKADFDTCPGPKLPGRVARLLGRNSTCQAVYTQETMPKEEGPA